VSSGQGSRMLRGFERYGDALSSEGTEKLDPGLVVGEKRPLQPLGPARTPRGIPLKPQGL
jgi:hypothetical protein